MKSLYHTLSTWIRRLRGLEPSPSLSKICQSAAPRTLELRTLDGAVLAEGSHVTLSYSRVVANDLGEALAVWDAVGVRSVVLPEVI